MVRRSGSRNTKIFLAGAAIAAVAIAVIAVLVVQRNRSAPYRIKKLKAEIARHTKRGEGELLAQKLEQLLVLDPTDIGQVVFLSSVYQDLGRVDDAEELLRDHLGRAPDDVSLSIALGELLLREERLPEVLSLLGPKVDLLKEHADVRERSRALILLGDSHTLAGNPEAAIPLLRDAVKLRQTYGLQETQLETGDARVMARLALGDALVAAGQWEEAEQTLREAYEAAPDGIGANLTLASVLDHRGRTAEAVELLERLFTERKETRGDVLPHLGEFLIRIDRTERLVGLAQELARADDDVSQSMAAYLRGLVALDAGQIATAERELTQMVEARPGSVAAWLLLARVALLAGSVERAETAYETALEIAPGDAEAELGMLELEERAGRWGDAEQRALRLLDRSLTRPMAASLLLRRVAAGQDPAPVREQIDRLRKTHPYDVSLVLFGAVFRILEGQSEQGIKELAELSERPGVDLGRALGLLAGARSGTSDALEALELLAEVASRDPRLTPARVVLATLYRALGRDDLAAQELDAAIEARPDLIEARLARAQLAQATGDLERAAAGFAALLEHDAQNPDLLFGLADVRLRQGQHEQALALFERVTELRPRDAFGHARLGRVRALLGRYADSLSAYQQARRLAPAAPYSNQDGGVFALQADYTAAARAFRRGATDTKDPRLHACAVLASALAGDLAEAASQAGTLGSEPPRRILGAALRAIHDDAQGARVVLDQSEVELPWKVARALTELSPEVGAPCLQSAIFEILEWEPERLTALRGAAEGSANPFVLWWALRGLEGTPVALTAAQQLAEGFEDVGASLRLADEQLRAGDGPGELETLRALRARFPRDPRVALRLGMALEREGKRRESMGLYAQVVAEEDSPVALNNLAYLLGDDPAQREVAIGYARRAVRIAPELASVHDTLGWLLFRDGRLHEAENALEHAVSLTPASPTPRYHLARVLEDRGARRRAANHYQLCLLSRAAFDEREEAERRLANLQRELSDTEAALELSLDAPLSVTLDDDGLGYVTLGEGSWGTLVRLRLDASPGTTALVLSTHGEGKRLEVGASATRELGRFLIPRAARLVLRGEPGASLKLSALSKPATEGEREPDEVAQAAQDLAPGKTLTGRFDAQGDRDHLRLALPSGDVAASVTVRAGTRTAVRVDVLELLGGRSRLAKRVRVERGRELKLPPLNRAPDGELVLGLTADERLEGVATAGDYRVTLTQVAPGAEREPNDRFEHALAVEVDREQEAQLGPADPADWFRVSAPVGTVLRISVSPQRAAELGLRLWERSGSGLLPRQVYRSRGTEAATAPCWRVPASGVVVLSVEADGLAEVVGYRLRVERTAPRGDQETEPNDSVEFAEQPQRGAALAGSLDGVERDWILVPSLGGSLLRLRLEGQELEGVSLGVYAWFEGKPRLVCRFRAGANGLEVPALTTPASSRIAVLLVQSEERNTPYTLTLDTATRPVNAEVEPNDEPTQALTFSGGELRGTLASPHDRDLVLIDAGRSLTVRATGAGAVAVRAWDGGPTITIPAGERRALPRFESGERDRVLVVVEAPSGGGDAAGTVSYELSW